MLKTVIATAILGLGITGAYFAIQNPINQSKLSENEPSNIPKNSPFVESLINTPDTKNSSSEIKTGDSMIETGNLTDDFINGLKQDIAQNNLDNNSNNLVVSDPNQITNDLLINAVEKFEAQRSNPLVDESKIKISNNNSRESIIAYVNAFQKIIGDTVSNTKLNSASDNPDPEELAPLIAGYQFAINKFYETQAPSSIISFHKKEIELLSKKMRAIKEVVNYKNDPITTMLASQELEKLQEEFDDLEKNFNKFLENI